tara:strand:+ start:1081 stop:3408 length:2328 start_codon:yes stop_codon:yes gene_type:complete
VDTKPKVFAHGSYIGKGGYNQHTRDFFRHLSKLIDVKVRNFAVDDNWTWPNSEPHNNEDYVNEVDKKLLVLQTLWINQNKGLRSDHIIYPNHKNDFKHNVNILLQETNHNYFWDAYEGPKIGYNVWESTVQPQVFFDKWVEFDQLWVPSKWQAECTVKQGADPNKVKVVPEGVDINTFYPDTQTHHDDYDGRFKFILFGRWDYRKSTKEIIETFLNTFDESDPVDLILSVDNKYGYHIDGCDTTVERLKKFNIPLDPRLKFKSFVSRDDYVTYMKKGHVFLSCARSEGWNLPLIEAMACGTPSIYSKCSGQLEFAEGKGLPVKILEMRPCQGNSYEGYSKSMPMDENGKLSMPGEYYEPDYDDLSKVMRDAYENYDYHKKRALEDAKLIHTNFNWDRVAEIAYDTLVDFLDDYNKKEDNNKIIITYYDGPKVEIKGSLYKEYLVEFIDKKTNKTIHSSVINNNMWTTCSRKWFTSWIIKINGKIVDEFNLKDKKVVINLTSKSIGDTLAWAPYVVEFTNKHKCKTIVTCFHPEWFKNIPAYKNIEFVRPGTPQFNYYVKYDIGWFKNDDKNNWDMPHLNPTPVNLVPLQQTATNVLGLKFRELSYGIDLGRGKRPIKGKYVVFGPQATAGCKEWDINKWAELSEMFINDGYEVVVCSLTNYNIPNTISSNGSLEDTATYLKHADVFIGLGSGLSWLNWALGKHTYMINGFVKEGHEFTSNLTKITNDLCIKCWNDPVHTFDPGDWNWCPVYKGTKLQHICQKSITSNQVFQIVNE